MGRIPSDPMKFSTQLLLPLLAVASACGGSGSSDSHLPGEPATGSVANALPDDSVILAKAYDNRYSVPDGFFVDERAATPRSYTVHHVLDESGSFEVCSDDLVEAQALEESDNAARAVNGVYVTSHETERYFEFVRELAYTADVGNISEPTSPGFGRVFKCAHTRRDGVDRSLLNGYSGRINPERLDLAALREFTEYLWQFRFFGETRRKVISSYGRGSTASLRHTLLLAFVHNQGQNACDRVEVVEWRFSADVPSGDVSRVFEPVHSFEATVSAGIPTLCQ
jgi:hypothetical protein